MAMASLFGSFRGGEFLSNGGKSALRQRGVWLALHGSDHPFSKKAIGERFIVIVFLHRLHEHVTKPERKQLEKLGFKLPACPLSPSPETTISDPGSDKCAPDTIAACPSRGMTQSGCDPFAPVCEPHPYGPADLVLLEFCCGTSSLLGRPSAHSKGCHVVRLTAEHDMTSPSGMALAHNAIEHAVSDGKAIALWGSLPCTGGCPWIRLNTRRGPKTRAKIAAHRSLFRVLFGNFATLARSVSDKGGIVSWEWPTQCDYWKYDIVLTLMHELSMDTVRFNGCMFGLVSIAPRTVGVPISKPWTVASTHTQILNVLAKPCDKTHNHTPCQGADTTRTEDYTPDLVRSIHIGLRRCVIPTRLTNIPITST